MFAPSRMVEFRTCGDVLLVHFQSRLLIAQICKQRACSILNLVLFDIHLIHVTFPPASPNLVHRLFHFPTASSVLLGGWGTGSALAPEGRAHVRAVFYVPRA